MTDLRTAEHRDADGFPEAAPLAPGPRVPRERRMGWRGWYGGLAMLIVCLAPAALLAVRPGGSLTVHVGPNFIFNVAVLLSALPSVAAFALLAPLVGYRRRDALLMTVPVANIYLAWVAGARVVQLRPGDGPRRWTGSREATAAAVLMMCLAGAGYLAWATVVAVLSVP